MQALNQTEKQQSESIEISIVIPVYKNAGTLEELSYRIMTALNTITDRFELVFVNDASPDSSLPVLHNLKKNIDHIIVISLHENVGQQEAIRTGILHSSGAVIIVMDADLQDQPEAIIQMYKHLVTNQLDAVFVSHVGQYQNIFRMISSKIFRWLIRQLTDVPNNAGSFVILKRAVAEKILGYNTKKFYMTGLIGLSDCTTSTILVPRKHRNNGESAYNLCMRLSTSISHLQCLLECKLK